jgi:hypothetical protein
VNEYFQKNFIGYTCNIYDRLWYMNDLKQVKEKHVSVLAPEFPENYVAQFQACVTCTATFGLSSSNGFAYPPYPMHLPPCGPKTSIYVNQKIGTS